jgi:ankyrin repeat protein
MHRLDQALVDAVRNGDVRATEQALACGSNPGAMDGEDDVLMTAVKAGAYECVRTLLRAGANARRRLTFGATHLTVAALRGDCQVVAELIHFCDPDEQDSGGDRAIVLAAQHGSVEMLSLLLPVSDYRRLDDQGLCPLDHARLRGHVAAASFIEAFNLASIERAELEGGVMGGGISGAQHVRI